MYLRKYTKIETGLLNQVRTGLIRFLIGQKYAAKPSGRRPKISSISYSRREAELLGVAHGTIEVEIHDGYDR